MLVYLHDIIITRNNNKGIEEVIRRLNKAFALKYLGNLNYFLGIQVIIN